jgi:hypothetical protein
MTTDTLPVRPYIGTINLSMLQALALGEDLWTNRTVELDFGPYSWIDSVFGVRYPGHHCIARWLVFHNGAYVGMQKTRQGALALPRHAERRWRRGGT